MSAVSVDKSLHPYQQFPTSAPRSPQEAEKRKKDKHPNSDALSMKKQETSKEVGLKTQLKKHHSPRVEPKPDLIETPEANENEFENKSKKETVKDLKVQTDRMPDIQEVIETPRPESEDNNAPLLTADMNQNESLPDLPESPKILKRESEEDPQDRSVSKISHNAPEPQPLAESVMENRQIESEQNPYNF